MDAKVEERAAKRARTEAGGDPMSAAREKLSATKDPHMQARLLLEFSSLAMRAEADAEAAIDFLFAFLQQSQSTANGDNAKSPSGADSSGGGGSNAVVVASIVRGLRNLLGVKRSVVEPMIQLDAMGEQLVQCISVPEDFKLRRDMLRIVLDCFIAARKFQEAEVLLNACIPDHDNGLRVVCLEGYIRIHGEGFRLRPSTSQELVARLCRMLLFGDDERTRVLTVQLLGRISETCVGSDSTSSGGPMLEAIINAISSACRDPSAKVRLEVASAFRFFAGSTALPGIISHLLHKRQISEDLSEIDTQSIAMLTSGALLTLLEDEDVEVATVTSGSIRALCGSAAWPSDLLDRIVAAHFDLMTRVGGDENYALKVLRNLEAFLLKRGTKGSGPYPVTVEELCYLIGSLSASSVAVAEQFVHITTFLSSDNQQIATRIVEFIVRSSQINHEFPPSETLTKSVRCLAEKWIKSGLHCSSEVVGILREATSRQTINPFIECCKILHRAFVSSTGGREIDEVPVRLPQFLSDSEDDRRSLHKQ